MTGLTLTIVLSAAMFTLGVMLVLLIWVAFRKRGQKNAPEPDSVRMIEEKVRAVGKLVGLEVHAKEIATAKAGWAWMPPALLSQARLAMIFQFEKQYSVELGSLTADAVREVEPGKYRIELPAISGSLRLVDVKPYDISGGKVLGLLDVMSMTAERQSALMGTAQAEAAKLFEDHQHRYERQAKEAIERQLGALLGLFAVDLEIAWAGGEVPEPIALKTETLAAG